MMTVVQCQRLVQVLREVEGITDMPIKFIWELIILIDIYFA